MVATVCSVVRSESSRGIGCAVLFDRATRLSGNADSHFDVLLFDLRGFVLLRYSFSA